MFFKFKHKFLFTATIIFSLQMLIPSGDLYSGKVDLQIRQQFISFLQSGEKLENLPESHPLSPLKDLPAVAITSYYLMEHDPSMLRRFYPQISRLVMNRFDNSLTTDSGLLLGTAGNNNDDIYLSPFINSLGNLEIYTLFLIASKIGNHTDALEYILWSRRFSDIITETFYDYNKDAFFPLDKNGYYLRIYSPEQLIPLILNRQLDLTSKRRIAENCLSKWHKSHRKEAAQFFKSPVQRSLIINLLSSLEFYSESGSFNTLISTPSYTDDEGSDFSHRAWIEMIRQRTQSENSFLKDWTVIAALVHLPALLQQESLLPDKKAKSLISDVSKLRNDLAADYSDLDSHIETITLINHLLLEISQISSVLNSNEKLWKVIDEPKWHSLSPRVRQLITESCQISIDELMRAKANLSEKLSSGNALELIVRFPPSPIISGSRINFKISLKSIDTEIDIKRAFLQIAGNRWKLEEGNSILLKPHGKALSFTGSFSLPPSTSLGIVQLPLFIDFLTAGKRVEIHKRKCLTIKEGVEVSLNFPSGKRLKDHLPVNLLLEYSPNYSIQGSIDGIFCDPLSCMPELPAKFRIKAGSRVTKLPLTISSGNNVPPGKFPFSLMVYLNEKPIAKFNDTLINPINWLHLGPLSEIDWILKNGWRYQDDLAKTHIGSSGNVISWNNVPYGATGKNGEILLSRLYGMSPDNCCLIYTLMNLPVQKEAILRFNSSNKISLWINSNPILSNIKPDNTLIHAKLRVGQNSILIAASWDKSPSPVIFEISDKSGLPIAGMENIVNELAGKFANLDSNETGDETISANLDGPREITLSLVRKECTRISVVGSFNSWNPETTLMEEVERGKWETTIVLSPGRYPYKFLIDNKTRIGDPSCKLEEPDGFGGINSVLIVK